MKFILERNSGKCDTVALRGLCNYVASLLLSIQRAGEGVPCFYWAQTEKILREVNAFFHPFLPFRVYFIFAFFRSPVNCSDDGVSNNKIQTPD